MSRDIPIIFSAPMVQALLDGRKTMTRRLLYSKRKREPKGGGSVYVRKVPMTDGSFTQEACYPDGVRPTVDEHWVLTGWQNVQPGDRLWVRENIAPRIGEDGKPDPNPRYVKYGADHDASPRDPGDYHQWPSKWTPSIHMPRWASRITLLVEDVKVERLQRISEEDAAREGAYPEFEVDVATFVRGRGPLPETHYLGFKHVWQNLHGDHSWDSNPWVVAIGGRVIMANIDSEKAKAA